MENFTDDFSGLISQKKSMNRTALALFVLLIVQYVAAIAIEIVLQIVNPDLLVAGWFQYALTIFSLYIVGMPVSMAIMRIVPVTQIQKRKLPVKSFFLFLMIMFTLLIAGSLIGRGVNFVIGEITGIDQNSEIADSIANSDLWIVIVYSLIIAPIMEELLFRKMLVDRLGNLGGIPVVLISGLFFGLFHGNFDQFFYAALVGVIFAFVYYNTGTIWYTVIMHSILNFFGGVLPTIIEKLFPYFYDTTLTEEAYSDLIMSHLEEYVIVFLTSMLPYAFAIARVVILILYGRKLYSARGDWNIPKGERAKTLFLNPGFILFTLATLAEFVLAIFY